MVCPNGRRYWRKDTKDEIRVYDLEDDLHPPACRPIPRPKGARLPDEAVLEKMKLCRTFQ